VKPCRNGNRQIYRLFSNRSD